MITSIKINGISINSHIVMPNQFITNKIFTSNENYIPATCHQNTIEILDLDKRNCFIHKNTFNISLFDYDQEKTKSLGIPQNNWQLLKYEKDSFFNIHQDSKKTENHRYVALLYSDVPFTGGDLICLNANTIDDASIITKIKTSDFIGWNLVVISISMWHYVEKIISGTRYVFKNNIDAIKPNNYVEDEQLCD